MIEFRCEHGKGDAGCPDCFPGQLGLLAMTVHQPSFDLGVKVGWTQAVREYEGIDRQPTYPELVAEVRRLQGEVEDLRTRLQCPFGGGNCPHPRGHEGDHW